MIANLKSKEQPRTRPARPRIGSETPSTDGRETRVVRTVEQWIGRHPALCLGAAMAVGVTLGWLIKRR